MGLQFTAAPLTEQFMQEQLAIYNGFFGYEELIEGGALDTTTTWDETLVGGATHSLSAENLITLETGVGVGDSVTLETTRNFGFVDIFMGTSGGNLFKTANIEFDVFFLTGFADFDEATTLLGSVRVLGDTRGNDHSVGLVVEGGVLNFMTKAAAAEELTDISAFITHSQHKKVRMEHTGSVINLYINDVLAATHTTTPPFLHFITHCENDAATNKTIFFGYLKIWGER